MKEIVLPPHLYDRIKASAGEHGGIGAGDLFDNGSTGAPLCAHGHAWGTCARSGDSDWYDEPELRAYLSTNENDVAVASELERTVGWSPTQRQRIPFGRWCELLNVKRGEEPRDELMEKRLEKSIEIAKSRHAHV